MGARRQPGRPPSESTLRWVESSLGGRARVVAWRRLTGGIASVVHRLTIDHDGVRRVMVLRRHGQADSHTAELVRHEAAVLAAVGDTGLPAPEPVAFDPIGSQAGGLPAILMTRVPGRPDLTPADPGAWIAQIAAMAVRIHHAPVAAGPFRERVDAGALPIPASAMRQDLWRAAFEILGRQTPQSGHAPQAGACFIHRDLQHFNLLWRGGRLSGVVDWTMSCNGPADFDTGHCRLNLAVLFGVDWAERFRLAYEVEAGRSTDPWWDLYAATAYGDAWRSLIPLQVAGRAPVDVDGMTGRVERLLETILRRT